jgi:LPXTG-motif cell wall-anchored protein
MIQAQGTGGIDFGDAGLGAFATAGGALLLTAAAYATSRRRRHRGSLSGSDS